MENVVEFLNRAADRCGFLREYYVEKDIPTHFSNIVVFYFYGDIRSECILSSLILKRIREEMNASKYLIVCSWRGHKGLFPFANEFWSIKDEHSLSKLITDANGFENTSDVFASYHRNLSLFFDVITFRDISKYYENGLTKDFHNKFPLIKAFYPAIPSSTVLEAKFIKEISQKNGMKVFLEPTKMMKGWKGKPYNFKVKSDFWTGLLDRFEKENIIPVVCQNCFTYDISVTHSNKGIFIREDDVSKVMSIMRMVGCVVDVFNDISRLAILARTPFISCSDHHRYNQQKEYEIDCLCAPRLARKYIFSFPTIIESGSNISWENSIYDSLISKIKLFVPTIDRNSFESTVECDKEVSYSAVRERKAKKLGIRLLKIPRD